MAETIVRPGVGEYIWDLYVQQYPMMLTNQHVWLSEKDGDWHRPLTVFIKHKEDRNRRVRSAKATARRSQRPWYGGTATADQQPNANDSGTATAGSSSSSM